MKEKIENLLKTLPPKIKVNNIATPFKIILVVWVGIILVLIASYFAFWVALCMAGKALLPDLLLLIKEMTGASMLASIGLMCAFFVDSDKDGIPDKFDNEVTKND